jgi:Flp pilus assembly protein TadD
VKIGFLMVICMLTLGFPLAAQSQNRRSDQAATAIKSTSSIPPAEAFLARYSGEPYVIEEYTTRARFESDGTQSRSVLARVHIQSALAVQKFAQLAFDYDSSVGDFEFRFVRVIKKNGSRQSTPPDSAKDSPAAVTRDATAYDRYREKSIAVPELQPGDTLEYQIASRSKHPQAGGQFWMQHTFLTDAIVVAENLEIDVPKSRHVTLKSPGVPYSTDVTSLADRTIYRWKHANFALAPGDEQTKGAPQPTVAKPVDVELTTFASWDEVARWYSKLQHVQERTSAEVRAKASELTRNLATDIEKTRALYDYISKGIRYVDLPFTNAGYEPHSAEQVLSQEYASGADKRVLLAAMLAAAGIRSQAALISDSSTLDTLVPSPGQFARALAVVREGDRAIWLDPSYGVAPFQFLPASLRNKAALVISSDGTGKIAPTPADPPFLSTQRVEIEGQVSDLGKMTARIRYELRGDNEFVLRLAFHRTPETQWKELGQTVLALDGLHGEVASVNPGDPTSTEKPFVLEIRYSQANFLDWSSPQQKIQIPLLALGLPDAPRKDAASNFELGSPLRVTAQLKLTLPQRFTARAPVAVGVLREYAEFQSRYHFDDHTLTAERSLDFKMHALPPSHAADYAAFSRAVTADQAQPLLIETSATDAASIPSAADASELFEAGSAALSSGNTRSAIPLFEQVLRLEPAHKDAWNKLGLSYMRARQFEMATAAFQKQLEINPTDPQAHNYLGVVLEQEGKLDQAALVFREQIVINPLDEVAHGALGTIYLAEHEYAQAILELDKAAVLAPKKAEFSLSLGEAYLSLAQNEQALAAFDKAVALSPTPDIRNAIAYSLADHKLDLEKAQKYAESAVSSAVADIQNLDPTHISPEQFSDEIKLANYWDTLGWVHFQQGDLDLAQRYIRAAWLLNQRGGIAFHLARIYEKLGQKQEAARTYALALVSPNPDPEARARITLLLGGNSEIADQVNLARTALTAALTFNLGKLVDKAAKSHFLIILSVPGKGLSSRSSDVRFVSGSEELRPFADRLRTIDFGPMFPNSSPRKLARLGTLTCSATAGECTFVLLPLDSTSAVTGE